MHFVAQETRRRLHVILVAPMFPPMPGGGSTHPFYLARALGALPGVRIHVIAPEPQLPKGDKHWFDARRVTVHRVKPGPDMGKVPLFQFLERTLRTYARIVSREGFSQYESVVVHGQHWAGIFVAMHLKHRFGVPLVATVHKTPIGGALGETARDSDASYCHFAWLATWPIDAFVAGSEFFATELRKQNASARVSLIPHGVPARWLRDRANPVTRHAVLQRLGVDPTAELIICPVRWDSRKRVPDFVTAAGKVLAEFPNRQFRFLITASIEGVERDKLMRSAQEVGILSNLVLQTLEFEDVPAAFRAGSVVVVPTDREGLGISVLEAMALKTPVVATDAEGVREIISHEKNGNLYAAGEADHLAHIIIRLLRERTYSSELVARGYATVTTTFSDTAMGARYEELYRSLLAEKEAGLSPPQKPL